MRLPIIVLTSVLLCLTFLPAEAAPAHQAFQVVNTAGFVEQDGMRTPITLKPVDGMTTISAKDDGAVLELSINGTKMALFHLEGGLSSVEWDSTRTGLLHKADVLAVSGKTHLSEIPAWGARLDWPDLGPATLVVFAPGNGYYQGFLVSSAGDTRFVRQMEFRPAGGPLNRPG